jgi:N-acyl-D-amino-acid deacylase
VLITNARIIDGSGSEARAGEVLVKGGRIAGIFWQDEDAQDGRPADLPEHGDLHRINAGGMVLAPGFIDAHAHGNPLSTPDFDNFLHMGVTTISLGQDGRSPEDGPVAAWMDQVDERGTGVHILHFIGHGTVRDRVGAPPVTGLEPRVLEQMQQVIADAMRDGSFGLTTGTEYNPGYHADAEELAAIARPVAEYGGLVMSHIRSEDDDLVEAAIEELAEQGRRSGARVHVSHIKIVFGKGEERAEEVLALLHRIRDDGVEITADLYPYAASFTGIGIVFPDWAMPPNDFDSVRTHRREDLRAFLRERIELRNGPEATLFGTAPWAGMTLAEVADSLGKPFEDVLIDDIPPGSASAAYFVMDENVVRRLLLDPLVMVSSDGSPTMRHPRGYGSFAKIIRQYVVDEGVLTLEEAVRKMTGLTASTLGLDDPGQVDVPRGLIREGFAADLVVFDPERVRDRATFEEPHRLAEGMSWVFVDGVPVIADGVRQPVNPTGVIRRQTQN